MAAVDWWFNIASILIGTAIGIWGIVSGKRSAREALALATEKSDVRWHVTWPQGQAALLFKNVGRRDTAFGVTIEVWVGMDMNEEHRRVEVGIPLRPGARFAVVLPKTRLKMAAKEGEISASAVWTIEWTTRLGNHRVVEGDGIYPAVAPILSDRFRLWEERFIESIGERDLQEGPELDAELDAIIDELPPLPIERDLIKDAIRKAIDEVMLRDHAGGHD